MTAGRRRRIVAAGAAGALLTTALTVVTLAGLAPLPDVLPPDGAAATHAQVESRDGVVLRRSYRERWNVHDRLPLHQVPALLREAVVAAEDRRFYSHAGADWAARIAAAWQNLLAGRAVRGASTISEQCVRMLYPRPRTLWSRWLEGFDAARLEARFGKTALLEFYLDQVPYAGNRRGVVQAARHYFDRDPDTLSRREMLTLAVLVRAPSRLDPWRDPRAADGAVARLAQHLRHVHLLPGGPLETTLALRRPALDLEAPHLVRRVLARDTGRHSRIRTTVDSHTQRTAEALLSQRLQALAARGAVHAAALVADHRDGAIRAWAVATVPGTAPTRVDAVTTPRQPGSALKPFVYALALEKGWTAATRIDDAPFAQSVGHGQHAYRNYSRVHYGAVTVREALGNSLNVPAVKALAYAGNDAFLQRLHALGFRSLGRDARAYGDGLALGNGEVSLLELVEAYATLANGGRRRALRVVDGAAPGATGRVLDGPVSSIIADILADPWARALEFGSGGVLSLPVQTAVKTGTSSDHTDAWAVGFDHRHVVGVWIGDLARRPMDRVSGASGPALVLRALFAHLNRDGQTRGLAMHPALSRRPVCIDPPRASGGCGRRREEWFAPHQRLATEPPRPTITTARIRQPGEGLHLALDPRLPADAQRFRFALAPGTGADTVEWFVNGERAAVARGDDWLWPLSRGVHRVHARVHVPGAARAQTTASVTFQVR